MLNDVEEECQFHFRNSEYIIVTLSADSLLVQRPGHKKGEMPFTLTRKLIQVKMILF